VTEALYGSGSVPHLRPAYNYGGSDNYGANSDRAHFGGRHTYSGDAFYAKRSEKGNALVAAAVADAYGATIYKGGVLRPSEPDVWRLPATSVSSVSYMRSQMAARNYATHTHAPVPGRAAGSA
jgi:hypothetical protein